MKKILAFTLCLVMVLCSAITVFADTAAADGAVLYSATFDGKEGSPKSLEDAGLELFEAQPTFKAEINENGGLSVSQTGSKYSNIGWKNDVVGDVDTYTMQVTFRWTDPMTNIAAGIQSNVSGYVSQTSRDSSAAVNFRYKYNLENKAGIPRVEKYGSLTEDVLNAWMPEANLVDSIPGNWTTTILEVNGGKLGKLTVVTVGADPVVFEAPDKEYVIPEGNPFLRFGNAFGLEIFDIRIVKGIGVNIQTPTLPARPTLQEGAAVEANPGNVLYYQKFNKGFNMTDLAATGLKTLEGAEGLVTIDQDGYLLVDNATGKRGYLNMFKLPDVVPEGLATYTWEMKFRFISSDNHGGVQPSWVDSAGNRKSLFLRYNQNGKFDNVATAEPVSANAVALWLGDDFGPGGWVTMKVAVKDGYLYSVGLSVEDKLSGQEVTWITETPELTDFIPVNEDLVIRFGSETRTQFESIRVVEGVDYTEYKGDYATKSYSGHEDSAAAEDDNSDVQQPTINDQKPPVQQKPNNNTETQNNNAAPVESDTTATEEKGGCGSFANASVALIGAVTVGFAACVAKRKREE